MGHFFVNSRGVANEWDDVFGPSDELVDQLLRSQFPELAVETARYLGEGWDCKAYRLGDWVFRFPRRPMALECLEVELANLPALGHELLQGVPTPEFPYPFLGCRFQPGVSLEQFPGSRRQLASELGAALRSLHSSAIPEGLPPDTLGKLDPQLRLPPLEARLGHLPEWLPTRLPHPREHVVNHGDLYCRHVLVTPEGHFSGLIDWGDIHRGHPGVDLACAWILFDSPDRELFWASYGECDDELLLWSRFRALSHTLMVREYARDAEQLQLLEEAERALARTLEG